VPPGGCSSTAAWTHGIGRSGASPRSNPRQQVGCSAPQWASAPPAATLHPQAVVRRWATGAMHACCIHVVHECIHVHMHVWCMFDVQLLGGRQVMCMAVMLPWLLAGSSLMAKLAACSCR